MPKMCDGPCLPYMIGKQVAFQYPDSIAYFCYSTGFLVHRPSFLLFTDPPYCVIYQGEAYPDHRA